MVQFDNQYRQIKIKIVYYGPALGGKTTCLQHIHAATDPQHRTRLYSLNTASDRTLFFDLLSLNLGRIRGYELAMQLYTVPGQVQYDATRRAVLSGADGVVFVADSQTACGEANVQSLENLWANLAANGLDRQTLPLVFQYNKRDLEPLLSVDELNAALNPRGLPALATVAVRGEGVIEGFATVAERTLAAVAEKLGVASSPAVIKRLQEQVRIALRPYLGEATEGEAVTVPAAVGDGGEVMSNETLVAEAVRANLAMTELNTRLDAISRQLERSVGLLEGVHDFGVEIADQRDPLAILRLLLGATIRLLEVPAAAVISVPGGGPMHEVGVHGVGKDPLVHANDELGEPLAAQLVAEGRPQLLARELDEDADSPVLDAIEAAGFAAAIAVPLIAQERTVGLLIAYTDRRHSSLGQADLRLARLLAATAAMGCANARAWQELENLNRGLEAQVAARTEELQHSFDEVQRMARDLEAKNRLVDDAYRELSELDRVKDQLIQRLSQELKTPVSSVVTAAKILDTYTELLPDKGARFVSIIRDEAEKLSEVIHSIFQASVLAGVQSPPQLEAVQVEDLFKRAAMPLRDTAAARGVKLKVLIPSGLETMLCDRAAMETALRAVLKNAIQFSHESGEVRVAVRRLTRDASPWLAVRVSDTGVGIAADELEHVFETFWQGGNLHGGRPRGVGLGLAIAKMVVESHGGSITIASTEGEGTELTITIPQGN